MLQRLCRPPVVYRTYKSFSGTPQSQLLHLTRGRNKRTRGYYTEIMYVIYIFFANKSWSIILFHTIFFIMHCTAAVVLLNMGSCIKYKVVLMGSCNKYKVVTLFINKTFSLVYLSTFISQKYNLFTVIIFTH